MIEFKKKPFIFGEYNGETIYEFANSNLIVKKYLQAENTEKFDLGNIIVHELKLGLKIVFSGKDLSLLSVTEIPLEKDYL